MGPRGRGCDDRVAREEQAHGRIDLEGLVGQAGLARAQDLEGRPINPILAYQRRDIDLGEDTEAFRRERLPDRRLRRFGLRVESDWMAFMMNAPSTAVVMGGGAGPGPWRNALYPQ
ncbi:MAG: hypothetical protein NVS3B12_09490 [Acidimicrobiales bacterium]